MSTAQTGDLPTINRSVEAHHSVADTTDHPKMARRIAEAKKTEQEDQEERCEDAEKEKEEMKGKSEWEHFMSAAQTGDLPTIKRIVETHRSVVDATDQTTMTQRIAEAKQASGKATQPEDDRVTQLFELFVDVKANGHMYSRKQLGQIEQIARRNGAWYKKKKGKVMKDEQRYESVCVDAVFRTTEEAKTLVSDKYGAVYEDNYIEDVSEVLGTLLWCRRKLLEVGKQPRAAIKEIIKQGRR